MAVKQDFKKKEALAAEKAARERQAADDKARKEAEELELKLVAARTKEEKEQGKLHRQMSGKQRLEALNAEKHTREKSSVSGAAASEKSPGPH